MSGETKTLAIGADSSSLDIFLTANGIATAAHFVGFQQIDAADVVAFSGVALNPSLGHYTSSGVIPAGFQTGSWDITWDIITAAGEFVQATEPFCVVPITVTIGFNPAGDKTSSIYEAVRLDIGDPDGKIFDDDFLSRVLTKAARRLNHRLGLANAQRPKGIPGGFGGPRIKVFPIIVDLSNGTVTPNNDEICDLCILMMEYIIITSETSSLKRLAATSSSGPFVTLLGNAAQDGVTVKNADGVEVSISANRLTHRASLHKLDVQTRKEELENAIRAFLGRQTSNYGKMIY